MRYLDHEGHERVRNTRKGFVAFLSCRELCGPITQDEAQEILGRYGDQALGLGDGEQGVVGDEACSWCTSANRPASAHSQLT